MNFAAITSIVSVVLAFLEKAKTAAPGILDAAKGLADQAANLVKAAKENFSSLLHPAMTQEETKAALDKMEADLDVALANVQGLKPPPLSG